EARSIGKQTTLPGETRQVGPNGRHMVAGCQRNNRSAMNQHEGVGHKDEASLLAPKRGYRRFDFSVAAHAGRNRLHHQRSRSGFERAQEISSTTRRRVGVEHDCYPTEMGGDLFEYLQPLAPDRGLNVGESCDVSTWPRKACHE